MTSRKGNFKMPFDPMAGEPIVPRTAKQWGILRKEEIRLGKKRAAKMRLQANRLKQAAIAKRNAEETARKRPAKKKSTSKRRK